VTSCQADGPLMTLAVASGRQASTGGGSELTEQRAARYRDVFAVAEFRALFGAHLLSVIGDQFARVALAVVVFARTHSASLTALTYALTFLPGIIAGPLLSGLADRFPRRRVMVTADVVRGVLVAIMAIPGTPFLGLCLLLIAVQMLAAPFDAARAAMLPAVFGDQDDHYQLAVGVSNMTYQGAQLLGFAAAGVIVAGINPSAALLIDAATFFVGALWLTFGVTDRPVHVNATTVSGWAHRVSAGARLVWHDRVLLTLVLLLCVPAFPVTAEGLAVPYASTAGIAPAAVGLLFAAPAAGSLLGIFAINRVPRPRRLLLMRPLATLSCGLLAFSALRPGLVLTVLVWGLSGVASAYFVVANAEYVRRTPDEQRGQAIGLAATACRATQGLGVLIAGVVADLVQPAFVIAAAGLLGAVYAWMVGSGWQRVAQPAGSATDI
jgi:MFS family permease